MQAERQRFDYRGAKSGDQPGVQAALANARAEYHRFETLRQQTDVSAAELDARRLVVETDEQKLQEAEERLRTISEVRQTDVDVAQSELKVALAEEEQARLETGNAVVTSPSGGKVMSIHAYPGEEVGPQGLLDLGKTGEMYVEAEVYEADIARVHTGQHARITSDLFNGQLSGVVTGREVGGSIAKASVLPADPVSYADARVFKVWIKLSDDGKQVARKTHQRQSQCGDLNRDRARSPGVATPDRLKASVCRGDCRHRFCRDSGQCGAGFSGCVVRQHHPDSTRI